ncbi:hypothetical protein F0Z19_2008 [Vibrio cyclitrophicus]|nr:hypothetical protein F0Z19_2008 [Vibrio cyclitrophicus]
MIKSRSINTSNPIKSELVRRVTKPDNKHKKGALVSAFRNFETLKL